MDLLVFAADALVVPALAWLLARALAPALPSALERLLAWGLLAVMTIAGAGVLLGAVGGLGQPGFFGVHLAGLALLGGVRRAHLRDDLAAARALLREILRPAGRPAGETALAVLLIGVALGLIAVAGATEPVVFDALTYRLSRVGHWLQEGRITLVGGDDARLNYMPVVPDLVMAWLLTATPAGYAAVAVAQAVGGCLALGATVGLARLTGVGRAGALGAAALVLGLPNVAPQFTSAYTDLFTAGVLAAGFFLWLAALRRGEGSTPGGAAAGLALGAKGTVLYFAPGLALAAGWLAWRERAPRHAWRRTLAAATVATLVFGAPGLLRNLRAYGGPLGPDEFVQLHHGTNPGFAGSVEKLRLNLASAFVQWLEPNSQPPGWQGLTRAAGEALIPGLPEEDPYAFQGLNRRANLRKIYALTAPDADVTSTGVLLPALALAATVAAWRRRKSPTGATALAWSLALAVSVLFLHWRVQWHPYLFRFLALGAPWLAALVVWWFEILPPRARGVAWIVAAVATVSGFVGAVANTYQAGWPAIARPGQSLGFHVYAGWRTWAAELDRPAEPLRPALTVNSPLAAFYRQEHPRRVLPENLSAPHPAPAEATLRPGDGWRIFPVATYLGREGRVMARAWLFEGDEGHPYSVAAYRALAPGEEPVPVVYRNRLATASDGMERSFLVRIWRAAPVRLTLANPGEASCHFAVRSPAGNTAGDLAPGARLVLEVPLPGDRVSEVTVAYARPASVTAGRIEATLAP